MFQRKQNEKKLFAAGLGGGLSDSDLERVGGGAGGEGVTTGTFRSNSGTQLNIVVSWTVKTLAGGAKTLDVVVSTDSYSLFTQSIDNGVTLSVDGVIYSADALAISYSGTERATNTLATFSIPNFAGTALVTATWMFRGTYGKTQLTDIVATGTVAG
ncbi:MAG: hypothetical protein IJU29_06985 [Oscillospiraceae bacterium]|nr:hypothetical protein [Oscillospiraceae bacterium]